MYVHRFLTEVVEPMRGDRRSWRCSTTHTIVKGEETIMVIVGKEKHTMIPGKEKGFVNPIQVLPN